MLRSSLIGSICFMAGLLSGPTWGKDHLLLVGGGPFPNASEVSIEKNVIWIEESLRERKFASRAVLFTAGSTASTDVVLNHPDDPEVQQWLPLARIYGEQKSGVSVFRRNLVPAVDGAATVASVTKRLGDVLGELGENDSLFLVYNGHGAPGWESPGWKPGEGFNFNSLRLWGESRLTVEQFTNILSSKPVGAVVRYVLPQCYSGGFARSVFGNVARPRTTEVRANQCGFFSVAENRIAEGCTPGINVGEYRDYSTFFFAALAGQTRLGQPLQRDPDEDRDGRVSLAEAHAYAITEGLSRDVPRSTSEYYLELWQPWYLRWHAAPEPSPDNPYYRIAARLAEVLEMSSREPKALATEAVSKRREAQSQSDALYERKNDLASDESALRQRIRAEFELEWPAAANPHGLAYAELVANQSDPMLAWIRAHPDYPQLEALQQSIEQTELERLERDRQAAGFARVHRMLELATIWENFERHASVNDRESYQSLVQCESWAPATAE